MHMHMHSGDGSRKPRRPSCAELTHLLTYLLTYSLTYSLTYLLTYRQRRRLKEAAAAELRRAHVRARAEGREALEAAMR